MRQGKTGELALSRSAGSPSIGGGEEVQDTESLSLRVDRRGGESVGTSLLRLSVFSVKYGERSSGWGGHAKRREICQRSRNRT